MKTFTIDDELNTITIECDDNGIPFSASVHWLNNLCLSRLESDPRCRLPQGFAWSKTTPFSAAVIKVAPAPNHDEYLLHIADQEQDAKDWRWLMGDLAL